MYMSMHGAHEGGRGRLKFGLRERPREKHRAWGSNADRIKPFHRIGIL